MLMTDNGFGRACYLTSKQSANKFTLFFVWLRNDRGFYKSLYINNLNFNFMTNLFEKQQSHVNDSARVMESRDHSKLLIAAEVNGVSPKNQRSRGN